MIGDKELRNIDAQIGFLIYLCYPTAISATPRKWSRIMLQSMLCFNFEFGEIFKYCYDA